MGHEETERESIAGRCCNERRLSGRHREATFLTVCLWRVNLLSSTSRLRASHTLLHSSALSLPIFNPSIDYPPPPAPTPTPELPTRRERMHHICRGLSNFPGVLKVYWTAVLWCLKHLFKLKEQWDSFSIGGFREAWIIFPGAAHCEIDYVEVLGWKSSYSIEVLTQRSIRFGAQARDLKTTVGPLDASKRSENKTKTQKCLQKQN